MKKLSLELNTFSATRLNALLDEIIDLLLDGQWHHINDIAKALNTDITILKEAINFFERFGFIKVDHPGNLVIIDTTLKALFQL